MRSIQETRTAVAHPPDVDEIAAALVRLNLETRGYHAAADASWRELLVPELSKDDYIDQLVRTLGFEGPLEAALAYTSHLDLVIDVHERFRAGFIAQDLLELGMRPSEISHLPQCVLAPFSSPLEALGWMYLSERVTLCHEEVRRYVNVRLPDAKDACAYLSASKGFAGGRMLDFGRQLERAARTPRMLDEVIAGAHSAFRTWIGWCGRHADIQRLG